MMIVSSLRREEDKLVNDNDCRGSLKQENEEQKNKKQALWWQQLHDTVRPLKLADSTCGHSLFHKISL